MKHYILFQVLGYNGEEKNKEGALAGFRSKIERFASTFQGIVVAKEDCMLFERENGVGSFGRVVAAAEDQHLKYEVIYLSSE